jgi:hypothetical protein
VEESAFDESREYFEELVVFLRSDEAAQLTHAELEERLSTEGRELLRRLHQDQLDLRSGREARIGSVADAQGITRGAVEAGHARELSTVFGEVVFRRFAYRRRRCGNLHPADAHLNLPSERHSHGLRRLAAIEGSRGSFAEAVSSLARVTGQPVGKRQVEELCRRAAVDVEAFYSVPRRHRTERGDVVVLSADGKGIVMRHDALRQATARAAAGSAGKLTTRLSKGERRYRKRMAEVGSVYEVTPVPREAADILARSDEETRSPRPAPVAKNKWLTASVVDSAASVVAALFDEARRRDPGHRRGWVALVDGNNHQIDRIEAEAADRTTDVTIVIDFIHVLEYIWKAAWSFFAEGDLLAEHWVNDKATAVLNGQASTVAAAIRRKATALELDDKSRENADTCANYLLSKRDYLDYPTALTEGWPIATGVIEGACRHLVKDRLDITGARWSLEGAEAILKLRALRSNGDFDTYWRFHLLREQERIHRSLYAGNVIPQAA